MEFMLPKSMNVAAKRYAGIAKGISWQILRIFIPLNLQLDKIQPFAIPKNPPKVSEKINNSSVPFISLRLSIVR